MTGDLNLVTAEALVQYRVREPAAYLFRARIVESSLRASSEWALDAGPGASGYRRAADDRAGRGRRAAAEFDPVARRRGGPGRLDRRGAPGPRDASRGRGTGLRRRRAGAERSAAGDHAGRGVSRPQPIRGPRRRPRDRRLRCRPVRSTRAAGPGRGRAVHPRLGRGPEGARRVPAPGLPRDTGRDPAPIPSQGHRPAESNPGHQPVRRRGTIPA